MAAPSGALKVGRYFTVLAAIVAVLYAMVFLTGNHKPQPKLGLDLQGGTSMTLSATTLDGKSPSRDKLNIARGIINQRVDSTGVSEAEVVVEGSQNIVVNVADKKADQAKLRELVAPAKMEFRAVLSTTSDSPVTATPSGSTSPSGSPAPSGSPKPTATAPQVGTTKGSTPPSSPSASPPASPGTPAPSPSASTPVAAPSGPGIAKLDDVKKKLGAVYAIGAGITAPTSVDAATLAAIAPFGKLLPAEVAALPATIQFNVPTVTCAQLNARVPGVISDDAVLNQQVVACDTGDNVHTKYLLDVAKVHGADISSAQSGIDVQNYGGWYVQLSFKSSGQAAWTDLTKAAMDAEGKDGQEHQVAIVLDNEVVTAPGIKSIIPGPAIINGGNIDENSSKTLATQLKFGSLPLAFNIQSIDTVSATIGLAQMQSGLLAGAIGLVLVVLYCLFYYRALGLVVVASLVASGAIVFASLVLLGRSMGFTLSLAGIAGFIVAIGITADSFVVFFERLKDEVKDGRTVRSAVPRAWVRARRTILSADAVSFIAAVILFWLASGPVAGFAFTLGLSTVIDLVIVFLFTHPLVSVLSGSRTFTSPRFSGLGGLREPRDTDAPAPGGRFGAMRTKES